ncbi:MAG: O-antigen ligase family protein [Betaproteobacteria bacterium]
MIPLVYVAGQVFTQEKLRFPMGIVALLIWMLFIFAFIPNTSFVLRSVGYGVWLFLDILTVLVAVQIFNNLERVRVLLRWYLAAFLIVSIVGLGQLVLGVSHLPAPFVQQWFIKGAWPRLNGFSYEPSYFATYLVMGWVLSAYLLEKRSTLLPRHLVQATFGTSTLALILATSRLGWATMIVWGAGYAFRNIRHISLPKFSLAGWLLAFNVVALGVGAASALAVYESKSIFESVAGGTGLFGTPAHSVNDRESSMQDTLGLVYKSPFLGYSLGGIAPAIGEENWEDIKTQEGAKKREGMSVFVEVLAASGVIGFIPFTIYILTIFLKPTMLARKCRGEYGTVLFGLVWALGIELLILQFNQNILRPYLWFHIAVLSATYAAVNADTVKRKSNARA